MLANSGQVTGIISEVAFSFMVQDPRLIIEVLSDRSLFSKLFRYRSIWVCITRKGGGIRGYVFLKNLTLTFDARPLHEMIQKNIIKPIQIVKNTEKK